MAKNKIVRTKNLGDCSVIECNRSAWAKELCTMHGARFRKHGTTEPTRIYEDHNLKDTPEYGLWSDIKSRCYNPKVDCYHRYGGRGIKMYEPWRQSFLTFYQDIQATIGLRPSKRYSFDRIDNDGNYEPGNIRWATQITQTNNTRVNFHIEYQGRTQTLAQWCRELDINYKMAWQHIKKDGWTVERAFKK